MTLQAYAKNVLSFQEKTLSVSCQSDIVWLTRKEFQILLHLYSAIGFVCSREELLAKVWGRDVFVDLRTIDRHVVQLRRKIKNLGQWELSLDTVWGVGYRLRKSGSLRS